LTDFAPKRRGRCTTSEGSRVLMRGRSHRPVPPQRPRNGLIRYSWPSLSTRRLRSRQLLPVSLLPPFRSLQMGPTFAENPSAKVVATLPKQGPVMHLPLAPWATLCTAGRRADIFTGRKVVEMGPLAPIAIFAGLRRGPRTIRCSANTRVSTTSGPRAAGTEHHANVVIFALGRARPIQRRGQMDLTLHALADKPFSCHLRTRSREPNPKSQSDGFESTRTS